MSKKTIALTASIALFSFAYSCAGGPAPPKPGTAAFSWQSAKESFEAGDYLKTVDHLDRVLRTENEFVPDARVWRLLLGVAMADAYAELTEQFEYGGRANKNNPTPFRRKAVDFRTLSERNATLLAELYANYAKSQPEGDVNMAFGYPPRGSFAVPGALSKIAQGQVFADGDIVTAQSGMLQRAVLLSVCAAVGAPKDGAKAQQMLKEPPVKAPRGPFELTMAQALYDASTIFGPMKGWQPVRQIRLLDLAAQALAKATGDAKEVKELKLKVERDKKAAAKKAS